MSAFILTPALLANPGATAAHWEEVPPEAMVDTLPDLHILGGAMMEAGIAQASEFVRMVGALKFATQGEQPDPNQRTQIRQRLAGLFSQIQDGEEWAQTRTKALNRRARLFGDRPSTEELQVFRSEPATPAALPNHPLASIVEQTDGKYRVFLWVQTNPLWRNNIHGLTSDGKRLKVSLKIAEGTSGSQINQILRTFLAIKLGLEEPQQVEIVSGQTHPERKSVIVHSLEIVEVLNRLNRAGPRYIGPQEKAGLTEALQFFREALARYRHVFEEVQELAKNLSEPEDGEVVSTLRQIQEGSEAIQARFMEVESLLAGRDPLKGAQTRRIRSGLRKLLAKQRAVLALSDRFFVIPAVARLKTSRLMEMAAWTIETLDANHRVLREQWDSEISEEVRQSHAAQRAAIHKRGEYLRGTGRSLLSDWRVAQPQSVERLLSLQEKALAFVEEGERFLESVGQWERELAYRETRADTGREGIPVLKPPAVYAEDYRHLAEPLAQLGRFVLVEKGAELSVLDQHLAEVTSAYNQAQREAVVAFGDDIEFWPGTLRNEYHPLLNLFNKVREGIKETRRAFKTALEGMEAGKHPGQVQTVIFSGLVRIRGLFGVLEAAPAIAQKVRPPKKPDADLLKRWKEQLDRMQEVVQTEKSKPFSLDAKAMQAMQAAREGKLRGWEEEGKAILAEAEGLKLSVPNEEWTKQMGYFYETIRRSTGSIPDSIEAFAEAFDDLQNELAKPGTLSRDGERFYLRSLAAYSKVRKAIGNANRLLTGKVKGERREIENLTDLIRNPAEPKQRVFEIPDRTMTVLGREVVVEGGRAKLGTVSFPLDGGEDAQDRKIRDIVSTLTISEAERRDSTSLAHPLFRAEVERRLGAGLPLRELLDVDDTLGTAVVFDHRFGTAFYILYKTGWNMREARAVVPMFHGGGGERSTGFTMVAPAIKLRNDFSFNAISFDAPNHGRSVVDERFHNLFEFIGWMDVLIGYFRYLSGGVMPVVAIGRSHGDNALDEYAVAHPGKLDGIIAFSGYDPAWNEATKPTEERRREAGEYRPHPTGRPMVDKHDPQWTFLKPESDEKRRKTPTLFISGTEDEEYSAGVPDFFLQRKARADRLGQPTLIVEGGSHDLLSLSEDRMRNKKEEIKLVYGEIQKFVEEAIRQFTAGSGG